MNRTTLLSVSWLTDQVAGDPEWLPHPVRLMGFVISRAETALRRPHQSSFLDLFTGGLLTLSLVGSTYCITAQLLRSTSQWSGTLGNLLEGTLGWTCLAAQNLQQEAASVARALEGNNLVEARVRLSRIVGRDTQDLDVNEICRGLIETVAESAADGIVAPLLYMAIGGVPLAMAYKAVSTLDSMIGHADKRYFYFGKLAARMDDVANYLPARLTALLIVGAAYFHKQAHAGAAWHIWQRDGGRHKSPNAGRPESAMAGALQVSLGGDNTYAGVRISSPTIGQEFPAPVLDDAKHSVRLISKGSIVGVIATCCLVLIIQRMRAASVQS